MISRAKEYIKNNKKEAVFLIIISLLALYFRVFSLQHAGDLWIDEIYSYYFSGKNSVFDVVKSLYNEDLHTPLYFILLHFWMKFTRLFGVGENDTIMRLLGFMPSFLIVPFSYFAGKKLFNKMTGAFAALFFAFSPFLIYYTTELRFYGMACFYAFLSSYYFVQYLQYGGRKPAAALIILNLLLLYTFNISFVFVFFQFLTAMIFSKEKSAVLKLYIIMGILYIPAFIMTAHGMFSYRNSICSFARDIFIYKPEFFNIFLQSYFSGNFFYAANNDYAYSASSLKNIKSVYLILFPVIFCLTGFIKSFLLKNKTLVMLLAPAMAFLGFEFVLAHFGLMSLTVRYTLISFPAVVLAVCFGLGSFKNKYLTGGLFILFLVTLHNFNFSAQSPIDKDVEFGTPLKTTLEKLDIVKDNDYILIPVMGKLYRRYTPKNARYLDFEITDMLLNDVRKYYPLVFDDDTISILNRKNAREILYDYTVYNTKSAALEKYLQGYFKKLKKGEKFILLVNNMNTINSMSELYTFEPEKKRRLYYKNSLYYMLMTRIIFDILDISNENLKLKTRFMINDSKYSDNNTGVFVFVKE